MAVANNNKSRRSISISVKLMGLIISLIFFVGFIIFFIFQSKEKDFYQNLAVFIIVSWLAVLIIYYSWAIGFYNVNYGWTNEDWRRLEEQKKTDPSAAGREPQGNPNQTETLGLPNGTIRGTIAVSLLVGGLAMMIASMSFRDSLKPNEYFIDNFEFFKTAYLMMIAFYFGNKSLELLKGRKQILGGGDTTTTESPTESQAGSEKNTPAWQPTEAKKIMAAAAAPKASAVPQSTETEPPATIEKDFRQPNSVG